MIHVAIKFVCACNVGFNTFCPSGVKHCCILLDATESQVQTLVFRLGLTQYMIRCRAWIRGYH